MFIPKVESIDWTPPHPNFGEYNHAYNDVLENILKIAEADSGTFVLKAYLAWLMDEPSDFETQEIADTHLKIAFNIIQGKYK